MLRHKLAIIVAMLTTVLSIACNGNIPTDEDQFGLAACRNSILIKKELMLAISDTTYNLLFSGDLELENSDPHTFWLIGRMMQTVQLVRTAEDAVAWVLALNDNVTNYSQMGNWRIDPELAEVAATIAIEHHIAQYEIGNQSELNIQSYVMCILEHYRTVNAYIRLMRIHHDSVLEKLIYREYLEWFNLNNAVNAIMTLYPSLLV